MTHLVQERNRTWRFGVCWRLGFDIACDLVRREAGLISNSSSRSQNGAMGTFGLKRAR